MQINELAPKTFAMDDAVTFQVHAPAETPLAQSTAAKRPADSPLEPPMTKVVAARGFSILKPAVPKEQTTYIRYKSLLQASPRGKCAKGKDFTALMKSEWDMVKAWDKRPYGTKPDAQLAMRKEAEDLEVAEKAAHKRALGTWATAWGPSAAAHLDWSRIAASADDYSHLSKAVDKVDLFSGVPSITFADAAAEGALVKEALAAARAELAALKEAAGLTRSKPVLEALESAVACGIAVQGRPAEPLEKTMIQKALATAKEWTDEFGVTRPGTTATARVASAATPEVQARVGEAVLVLARFAADDLQRAAEGDESSAIERAQAAAKALRVKHGAALCDAHAGLKKAEAVAARAAHELRCAAEDKALVEKLRRADAAALAAHAKQVREGAEALAGLQAELDELRAEKVRRPGGTRALPLASAHSPAWPDLPASSPARGTFTCTRLWQAAAEAERRRAEASALASAACLPREVGRALQGQMVYIQGLKYTSKSISYTRGGVTPAAFAAAFGVAQGSMAATKSPDSLGVRDKPLRYGAALTCGDVTLRLNGETLLASAAYGMW